MKNFYKHLLWIGFFAIGVLIPVSSHTKGNKHKNDEDLFLCKEHKKKPKHKRECFKHNIQLQLSDSLGFPVEGTEFWITLDIIKEGPKVTIQFPVINFQTGPVSRDDSFVPLVPGGYLYTADGFLPENLRPNDLVYRSILAASNNGASQPFTFVTPPEPPYENIPSGYILSITNAGAIVVQCAGTFGNIIPPGPQILMPSDITYVVKPKVTLCKNYIIDPGFTNTTEFTGTPAEIGLRDSHVNDAFDNVVAWAWASNANIHDKTNNTTNVFVAIGKINNDGTLSIGSPIQLSDLAPGFLVFDTAVAINRKDKDNIVVSYGVHNGATMTYRAVLRSPDNGVTWVVTENGPTKIQPQGGGGDNPGVRADKYGNIWYGTTNYGASIDQPTFWISTDGGDTFSVAYTAPAPAAGFSYDFPQFCFGGDGLNYGLNFVVDYINGTTEDSYPVVGFISITGPGVYDTSNPLPAQLTSLLNVNVIADITASADGRIWTQGVAPTIDFKIGASSYIQEAGVIFKSPGAIDRNYAGPWQYIIWNGRGFEAGIPLQESQPFYAGYLPAQPQSIIYDDSRQALYALFSAQYPDYSQNTRLYFIISRDNGQTWSNPIDISTTDFANRGFQSMALDPITGNLVFGWYDGRNDPTYKSVQYFGALLPAKELDALVVAIPLSNPLYKLGSAAVAPSQVSSKLEVSEAKKVAIKNRHEGRLGGRLQRKPKQRAA